LVAALAALLLAIEVGLSATLALLLYVVAAWTWRNDGHARVIRA
jgi:hypothetical protein